MQDDLIRWRYVPPRWKRNIPGRVRRWWKMVVGAGWATPAQPVAGRCRNQEIVSVGKLSDGGQTVILRLR